LPLRRHIPGEAAVGLRSERGLVLISVMLRTGLVAIDSSVVATAVPSIVGEVGGFNQFPWLFSAYLLGQAVTAPIYAPRHPQVHPRTPTKRRRCLETNVLSFSKNAAELGCPEHTRHAPKCSAARPQ
jgi:hypothetical protein